MRKLLNTVFITTPHLYLRLDGANLVVWNEEKKVGRLPLHNLEGIVTNNYTGMSPALMAECMTRNIAVSFITGSGKFQCRVVGPTFGNVLLRKQQYRVSDSENDSLVIAKNFIIGKLYNQRWVLERFTRDHVLRIDQELFKRVSSELKEGIDVIYTQTINLENLRGIEGQLASRYFYVFDQMMLQQKESFRFNGRSRRPPLDRVNALLSLSYTLLTHDCAAALESVGLDPYVGFMHQDRPGRLSLALDMLEELRSVYADRFCLGLINRKLLNERHFLQKESGAVLLTDEGRKIFFDAWQSKKNEKLRHPFLGEQIQWGLVPYVQALLLARYLRGDLDEYPPFLWK